MLKTLRDAWKIPELRKKLIFTLLILLAFRLGSALVVPYVNTTALSEYYTAHLSGTVLGLYNAMSGSAFSQASVLALGIQPYINASIIIQLLSIAIPALERMSKEGGEEGKKKIARITRYTTVALGLLLGYAYFTMLLNNGVLTLDGVTALTNASPKGDLWLCGSVIVLAFTAGSAVVMWLGEQITEHGIGNGISMILFAGIIGSVPAGIESLYNLCIDGGWKLLAAVVIAIVVLLMVVFVVFINDAERRIPVQYAKRVVGRKVYGGQSTNLPIKVAMSGVMPVIFAQSIAAMPSTIQTLFFGIGPGPNGEPSGNWWYDNVFGSNTWPYAVGYFLLIFFFSWFYSTIQYDPVEVANNLKKNGGFIPGFRPGKPTADFIKKVINKIIIFGAIYLAIVALLPLASSAIFSTAGINVGSLAVGGTSTIIVVGVALETVKALEAQMLMRHYKGFLD